MRAIGFVAWPESRSKCNSSFLVFCLLWALRRELDQAVWREGKVESYKGFGSGDMVSGDGVGRNVKFIEGVLENEEVTKMINFTLILASSGKVIQRKVIQKTEILLQVKFCGIWTSELAVAPR